MANLKYYNESTSEWETVVIGKQGPSGIANATAPVTYNGGTQTVGLTDAFIGQTVRSYANASARAAAIPSPTEGMVAYLNDSNLLSIYDGSNWKTSLATNGGVLQVVRGVTTAEVSTSSNSMIDTNLSATITPKSATSTIFVFVNQGGLQKSTGSADNAIVLNLVLPNGTSTGISGILGLTSSAVRLTFSHSFVASYTPNSTSPQTFKTQFANFAVAASVTCQIFSAPSQMILMEVAT
jgi:hypothetical protein